MDSLDCDTDRIGRNGSSARSSPSCLGLQITARSYTRFSWRVLICAWISTLCPCLMFFLPLAAFAQGSLEVSPSRVELCAGRIRLVRVTATNLGPASTVQLNWKTDTNAIIKAESLPQGISKDAAAMSTWLLHLSAPPTGAIPGVIHLYAKGAATAKTDVPIAAASLEVNPPAWSAEFPAKLELFSAWETINEKQKAIIVAAVSNTSLATLRVNRIFLVDGGAPFVADQCQPTITGANFVADQCQPTHMGSASTPRNMKPGETLTWTFLVYVKEGDRPPIGKHQLVFQVDASATVDGCERNGSLVAHRNLGFAVIGESAILTALAIPSFLLVPGFLFLLAPSIFWRFKLRPPGKEDMEDFPLKPMSPEFWTVSVTVSIVGFLLASLLTGRSDMFVAYRFEDVVWTWMASLIVGTLAYLGYVVWRRRAEFTYEDKPIDILEKLGRKGTSLNTMMVEVDLEKAKIGSGKTTAYVLACSDAHTWISPRIELRTENLDEETLKPIKTAFDTLNAGELASALKMTGDPKAIAIWGQSKLLGPRRVPNDCVIEKQAERLVSAN